MRGWYRLKIDYLITDALVYTLGDWQRVNVAIGEEKIVGIHSPSKKPDADRTINASGLLVVPGLIDSHVHMRDPGATHLEDFETGTKAAAAGGVTMIVDMPSNIPAINTAGAFKDKVQIISKKAVVDFGLWAGATYGNEIPKLLELGALGIKFWTIKGLSNPELTIAEDGAILRAMREIAASGGKCMVHPSNCGIFNECATQMTNETIDYKGPAYEEDEDYISDITSINVLLSLSKLLRLPLHIAHIRSKRAIDSVLRARALGQTVSLELNPKYVFLTKQDKTKFNEGGFWGLARENAEYLWRKVLDGSIEVIATDHGPNTIEGISTQRKNKCLWTCGLSYPSGPQIENYLSLLVDKAEMNMKILAALVRCCSENPAKMLGLYPRKGAIAIGSDADITIIDPRSEYTISSEGMYSKPGWTIYEGRRVKGKPVKTLIGGSIVMDDGDVIGKPGHGKFIRKLAL